MPSYQFTVSDLTPLVRAFGEANEASHLWSDLRDLRRLQALQRAGVLVRAGRHWVNCVQRKSDASARMNADCLLSAAAP